jgi:hypothetical protein
MAEPAAIPDRTKAPKPAKQKKLPKDKQPKEKQPAKDKQAGKQKEAGKDKSAPNADTKGLSVTRAEDLGLWYSEVLTKAGIVSYYDVQDMCRPVLPGYTDLTTLLHSRPAAHICLVSAIVLRVVF